MKQLISSILTWGASGILVYLMIVSFLADSCAKQRERLKSEGIPLDQWPQNVFVTFQQVHMRWLIIAICLIILSL